MHHRGVVRSTESHSCGQSASENLVKSSLSGRIRPLGARPKRPIDKPAQPSSMKNSYLHHKEKARGPDKSDLTRVSGYKFRSPVLMGPIDLLRPGSEMSLNRHCWRSPGDLRNFECKPDSVHALRHTGAGCHFVVWSSLLVVIDESILGRSVLAVTDDGFVVQ
ncbi:hypothetical protein TNCV_908191 [Trichonephila clavipes]|nr:hypothetical protein TNCV_908191 [Trichonephila clavipes]